MNRAVLTVALLAAGVLVWVLPLEIAALPLLILPVIDWAAVVATSSVLRYFPRVRALRERRNIAVSIAALSTLFSVLAAARLGHLELPGEAVGRALVLAVCALSLINGLFLWQYRHALFGRARDVPVAELHGDDEREVHE